LRENYRGDKRKKEDARKKKQEEKRNRRLNKSKTVPEGEAGTNPVQMPLQ
jgi:hypothetical protein